MQNIPLSALKLKGNEIRILLSLSQRPEALSLTFIMGDNLSHCDVAGPMGIVILVQTCISIALPVPPWVRPTSYRPYCCMHEQFRDAVKAA